jgi:5-methylthioadenosine/S-adenosylhomocysteine deaminase
MAHIDRQLMAAQPSNVDTVIADGRILKRGGKLVAVDPRAIVRDAMRASTELRLRAG